MAPGWSALRLCPDEAMVALGFDLSDEQARDRLELMQWDLAQELLGLGTNVVIENGFSGPQAR